MMMNNHEPKVTRINGQRERLHKWTPEELRNAIKHKLERGYKELDEADELRAEYIRQTGQEPDIDLAS